MARTASSSHEPNLLGVLFEFPGPGSLLDAGGATEHGGIRGGAHYLVGRGKGFIVVGVVLLPIASSSVRFCR